jgi:hypothetical protein
MLNMGSFYGDIFETPSLSYQIELPGEILIKNRFTPYMYVLGIRLHLYFIGKCANTDPWIFLKEHSHRFSSSLKCFVI